MSILQKLVVSFGLATSILQLTAAVTSKQDSYDTKIVDIRECRQKGFDPMRLACPTCNLLPEEFQEACKGCCQSYLGVKRRTNPYQAAVLVKSSSDSIQKLGQQPGRFQTEIDMLLDDKEEWTKLLKEKGGKERLQVMIRNLEQDENTSERDILSLLIRRRPSVEVLMLDEKLPAGSLSYEMLKDKATEIISLQGLSKDDIKDLLMTLLP